MFSSKSRFFQDFAFNYTPDLKFEIPNFSGENLTEPLPRPLPRSFSSFSLDFGFARFGPPNFWSVVAPLYWWSFSNYKLFACIFKTWCHKLSKEEFLHRLCHPSKKPWLWQWLSHNPKSLSQEFWSPSQFSASALRMLQGNCGGCGSVGLRGCKQFGGCGWVLVRLELGRISSDVGAAEGVTENWTLRFLWVVNSGNCTKNVIFQFLSNLEQCIDTL